MLPMMDDQLRSDCKGDGEGASRGAGRETRFIDIYSALVYRESTNIIKHVMLIT